ncbi:MAG: hypothetical protein GY865_07245 [candidate division Zixibacteria bacterium]|nr:hypothetical protein [candidate division Zixibacteria bacterium]
MDAPDVGVHEDFFEPGGRRQGQARIPGPSTPHAVGRLREINRHIRFYKIRLHIDAP